MLVVYRDSAGRLSEPRDVCVSVPPQVTSGFSHRFTYKHSTDMFVFWALAGCGAEPARRLIEVVGISDAEVLLKRLIVSSASEDALIFMAGLFMDPARVQKRVESSRYIAGPLRHQMSAVVFATSRLTTIRTMEDLVNGAIRSTEARNIYCLLRACPRIVQRVINDITSERPLVSIIVSEVFELLVNIGIITPTTETLCLLLTKRDIMKVFYIVQNFRIDFMVALCRVMQDPRSILIVDFEEVIEFSQKITNLLYDCAVANDQLALPEEPALVVGDVFGAFNWNRDKLKSLHRLVVSSFRVCMFATKFCSDVIDDYRSIYHARYSLVNDMTLNRYGPKDPGFLLMFWSMTRAAAGKPSLPSELTRMVFETAFLGT